MDKNWIDLPSRMLVVYVVGIDNFLAFVSDTMVGSSVICCLCRTCGNRYNHRVVVVREHLISHGFSKNYKQWVYHGELYIPLHCNMGNNVVVNSDMLDDMVGMVNEVIRMPHADNNAAINEQDEVDSNGGPNKETGKYLKLLENAQSELYPGYKKFTPLSFIVRLLHKVLNHGTDKLIDMLLGLLNKSFPKGVKLPNSYYEAQKITENLGFTYKTLDACPNGCMLFRNEDTKLNACVICGSSRWKHNTENCNGGKKLAVKQARYFPLKPNCRGGLCRLKQLNS